MIVAGFILSLWALFIWIVWDDLSDLIARQLEEIGAGGYVEDRVPSTVLTATLTSAGLAAGADSPFDQDAA